MTTSTTTAMNSRARLRMAVIEPSPVGRLLAGGELARASAPRIEVLHELCGQVVAPQLLAVGARRRRADALVGWADLRRRAVEVGDRLLVAGLVRLVRRAPAGVLRPGTQWARNCVAEQGVSAQRCLAGRDGVRAPARLEADVHAVAVEVLALAGDPDECVPELLVVLEPGRQRPVRDLDVAGGQDHVAHAAVDQVDLGQEG